MKRWVTFVAAVGTMVAAQGLEVSEFKNPAVADHPETWFHFIGGNISTNGIAADLAAIKAAGISGVHFFHGQFGGPWPGVAEQIRCLSEKWDGVVSFLGDECKRRGLTLKVQNCPGWAMSGGPWIAPSNAMRHVVSSRRDFKAGEPIAAELPLPYNRDEIWRDYREIAVLAFPVPVGTTVARCVRSR